MERKKQAPLAFRPPSQYNAIREFNLLLWWERMRDRYIAFDVETPNYANNRMSAIGVAVIENGEIADEFYSLVNPEAHFDRFNIELTGITPELAADAPAFPELWTELEGLMDSGLLVAHNAPFDMSVLAKCLRYYDIRWHPRVEYACTCRMGKRLLPQLPNHKLNTLCDYNSGET